LLTDVTSPPLPRAPLCPAGEGLQTMGRMVYASMALALPAFVGGVRERPSDDWAVPNESHL